MAYPTSCLSAYCGKILCDECRYRQALVAYHAARGALAQYEADQRSIRANAARPTPYKED